MKPLETERLILRELTEEDAPFIVALLNEPSFLRFIGDRGVRTVDDARAYLLKGPLESYKRFGFGLYLVMLQQTNIPIGICGLIKRETFDDVDIGFAFPPAFWSKGYAFESAKTIMAYGRDVCGLKRIIAIVDPDNARSIGLLGKLGLTFERVITLTEGSVKLKLYAMDL